MSHPNVACGPVPSTLGPRDLPSLVAELVKHLGHAEEHLQPALRELQPSEPMGVAEGRNNLPLGTLFDDLAFAVDRAVRVARLAEQVAARVGHCPPKPPEDPANIAGQLPNHRCFTVRGDNPVPSFNGR
jgi:hypothetical protein